MTVADLIQHLQLLPPDTTVAGCYWNSYWAEFEFQRLEPEHLRLPSDIEWAVATDDTSIRSDRVLVWTLDGTTPEGWPRL